MVQDRVKVERALVSVFDKTGLVDFVAELYQANPDIEIISSGGTAGKIKDAGYRVIEVSDYTGYPESPEGLVKTLHPKIHGGLLLEPEKGPHIRYMEDNKIHPIDLVVVNLYPFEKVVEKGADIEEAREMIDIGGPAMIRAAAKGYKRVAVLVDPNDYARILNEMRNGGTTLNTRFYLARKVFETTAAYDAAIAAHMLKVGEQNTCNSYFGK